MAETQPERPFLETTFTRLVGLRVPIQVAPLPFHGAPDLAVAAADAGALAMMGFPLHPASVMEELLEVVSSRSRGVFGVNFLIPFLDRENVRVAARRARVVEFFYGDPDPTLIELVHRGGALAAWQIGSSAEAVAAERAGCDFVVAQGIEAGGHVRGRVGTLTVLAEVLDAVCCPVVAAGGIGSARQLAAVLAAGAAGARLGTRFLAASEADVHEEYRERLIAARAADTVLTEAFSTMWPGAPHRVLRSAVEALGAHPGEVVGSLPTPQGPFAVPRGGVPSPTRATTGSIAAMCLYAGESVDAVDAVEPAAQIIDSLVEGASELLRRPAAAPPR